MNAARRKRDHNVSLRHTAVVEDVFFIDHSDGKTRQIVFVFRIKARHFRRFAADKRRAAENTAVRNAFNDLCYPLGHVFAARDIVEEKKRFCSATDNVVDAHRG